ncbi:MAG: methionine--tRNA ligase [Chloroflexi bacterium]|nr:methionine--tRNA ligase [Chloroflexota bacterium]
MSETILVAVAWPYANGPIHHGQLGGAYLPADIFARYHRTKGNRVLMVSGSDAHGTPVTVRAENENRTPGEVVEEYHTGFLETWQRIGISFDLFTSTATANHATVSQGIFRSLLNAGYLYTAAQTLHFDAEAQRFLPDRYVEGACPHCGYDKARGDQCDDCGRQLNAADLIAPRSKISGTTPVLRESEHYFLKLSALSDQLEEWLGHDKEHWRKHVLNFSLGMIREGLHDRPITRDIDWGVPVPVDGFTQKRIYVWFEAVIGYLSAAKEWAQRSGDPDGWRDFWQNPDAKSYYFIGKDNVPFHTIVWPAMLMGVGGLALPYDVPANQYITMSGSKASTSQNWAVWVLDYLSRYDPDPLRYALASQMPETSDSDFSWSEFLRRNNDELVGTWGNLVNRVLTFTARHFDGKVPDPGPLDEEARRLLDATQSALDSVDASLHAVHLRQGLQTAFGLAQEANRYLDATAPWRTIASDRQAAARSLYTALNVIAGLRTVLYPYLPFTCTVLHGYLGAQGTVEEAGWRLAALTPGAKLGDPQPLFRKLDPSIIEEEEARLGA